MTAIPPSPSAAPAATTSAPSCGCWRTIRSAAGANGSRTRCRRAISGRSRRLTRDPNIQLVVAEDGTAPWSAALQLCILPGLSSQGASRGLIEDVRVATHCRSRGIGEQIGAMGRRGSARQRMQAGRAAHAQHPRRCAAILQAAGISAEPCRDDLAILIALFFRVGPGGLAPIAKPALRFNPVNAG